MEFRSSLEISTILNILLLFVIVGVIVYYVYIASNNSATENNKDSEVVDASDNKVMKPHHIGIPVEQQIGNTPYSTDPIRGVDDYEYSLIFKNEGDRGITKASRDAVMSAYPMDWSVQPPSSSLFQSGLASFKESFENPTQPPSGPSPYASSDGSAMVPPDLAQLEKSEKEILQTYKPKDPQSLTTYDGADVAEIIDKIYEKKGMVAQFKETGPNQYTIINATPKDKLIVWEDDKQAPATSSANAANGEGTIVVPAVAAEVHAGMDPFYSPSTDAKTRDGKWDYTSWTPGLERMFAPTEPQTNWY